jgi:WD40 repeat protein
MTVSHGTWSLIILACCGVALAGRPPKPKGSGSGSLPPIVSEREIPPTSGDPEPKGSGSGQELGHLEGGCAGMAFSRDGTRLIAGGAGVVFMWDVKSGKKLREFEGHKGQFLRWSLFSPDEKAVAASGDGNEVFLWDAESGKEIRRFAGHADGGKAAVFTRDGKKLITTGFDEMIRMWDVKTGEQLWEAKGHPRVTYSVALSPDGKLLASGGDQDISIRIWDPETGKELRQIQTPHTHAIQCVAFDPSGRLLASGGEDQVIRIWEVASRKCVREMSRPDDTQQIGHVDFSSDGRLLVSASYSGAVRLWDVTSGKEIKLLGNHTGWSWTTVMSPAGGKAASSGQDGHVMVWNYAERPGSGSSNELTPAQAKELWNDLASTDSQRAFNAVLSLANDPVRALAYFEKQLEPVKPPPNVEGKQIARWIEDLDSDSFDVREEATRKLKQAGVAADEALRLTLKTAPSLEAKNRIETLLNNLERQELTADELQQIRALQVLEMINSPQTRSLVAKLAKGDRAAVLTREAQQVLERCKRESP